MTDVLLAAGVLSLASSAMLGWLIALHRADPKALAKGGIRAPHRVMQVHLDQVMMGLILLAVPTAFPDLPGEIAVPLLIGTILNPLGFVPLAFRPDWEKTIPFRGFVGFSFIATSGSLVGLAVWVLLLR